MCLECAAAQEEALRTQSDAARRRREAAEAAATPEERVVMYAAKKDRARALQKQEVRLSDQAKEVPAPELWHIWRNRWALPSGPGCCLHAACTGHAWVHGVAACWQGRIVGRRRRCLAAHV